MAKRNYVIIVSCFILFSGVLLFSIFEYVGAQPAVEKPIEIENSVVKIPPPIEGLIPKEHRKAQRLNKEDISILSANGVMHKFTVELAISPLEQRIGMMYREYITENTGMLFLFDKDSMRKFWMKNTLIPLDIIFIRSDGVIHHIHRMAEPNTLKRISSEGEVMAVLEIAGGASELAGINVGDRVLYKVFIVAE